MARKRIPDEKKRLVGTWRCCDHFSDVVVKIGLRAGKFNVFVLDKYDGEKPEVYNVAWNEKQLELSFAAHWSSGRFVRYRFMPSLVAGRLELTFTYTDQELWERA